MRFITKHIHGDRAIWAIVALLSVAGFAANYTVAAQLPSPIKLAGWIVLACLAALVTAQTAKGRQAREFARLSHIEMRKVFWPTRPEVVQTTMIVVAIVAVMAVILLAMDAVLLQVVGWLTGQTL